MRTKRAGLTVVCLALLLGLPAPHAVAKVRGTADGEGASPTSGSTPAEQEPAVPPVRSAAPGAAKSVDEIALELVNPVSSLFSVSNRFDFWSFQGSLPGAGDQRKGSWEIEPAFPFVLSGGGRIVLRARVPIRFGQPTYAANNADYADWRIRQEADRLPTDHKFFQSHDFMDDFGFGAAYGRVGRRGSIAMIGIAGQLPTSEDGSTERDKILLGPDAAYGRLTRWGMIGARLTHLTDVADGPGSQSPYSINETTVGLFFAYALGHGWQIVSNPTALYDWEGARDNRLLLPFGGGVSKTLRVLGVPLKTDLEVYHYLESPDAFGRDWQVTLRLIPVVLDRSR